MNEEKSKIKLCPDCGQESVKSVQPDFVDYCDECGIVEGRVVEVEEK